MLGVVVHHLSSATIVNPVYLLTSATLQNQKWRVWMAVPNTPSARLGCYKSSSGPCNATCATVNATLQAGAYFSRCLVECCNSAKCNNADFPVLPALPPVAPTSESTTMSTTMTTGTTEPGTPTICSKASRKLLSSHCSLQRICWICSTKVNLTLETLVAVVACFCHNVALFVSFARLGPSSSISSLFPLRSWWS